MSDNVSSAISKSGVVENMDVAVEILFVVAMHEQVSCFHADLQSISGPPYWISEMCQIWF